MTNAKVVGREEWLGARLAHLEVEKEFDRQRDALSRARRDLPWVRVETDYVFDAVGGEISFSELFGNHQQLIV